MFPFIFEWQWNADHFIFLGLLYLALTIIACGLIYCLVKTWVDLPLTEDPDDSALKVASRSRYSQY